MPQLELRVPLSPTQPFVNRLRLLAASVREFYPGSVVRAYIGASEPPPEWLAIDYVLRKDNIEQEWIFGVPFDAWAGTRSPYIETMNRRWSEPVDSDFVLIADCDVLAVRPFPELFETEAVAGVMTHVPPMYFGAMQSLWRSFTGSGSWPEYVHSGAGIMCSPFEASPWYVNSGMCFLPRDYFERMVDHYHKAIAFLRSSVTDTYWFDQLALGLAAAKAQVPCCVLPLRFNFPNQAAFDDAHPGELADCRFLHYLRTDTVDRDRDFADLASMQRFVSRPGLIGSNRLLQQRVGQLLNKVWPAAEYTAETAPHA